MLLAEINFLTSMKRNIILACLLFCSINIFGQKKIADRLGQFIGTWEGEGWHYHNPEKTNYFVQTCRCSSMLNGSLISCEQQARLKAEPDKILFNEFAIWRMGTENEVLIDWYREGKAAQQASILIKGDTLVQKRKNENFEFFSYFTVINEYVMEGYEKIQGGDKKKIFEMTLKKTDNK